MKIVHTTVTKKLEISRQKSKFEDNRTTKNPGKREKFRQYARVCIPFVVTYRGLVSETLHFGSNNHFGNEKMTCQGER